jgi:C-terminal processing protease CtpA/Prc
VGDNLDDEFLIRKKVVVEQNHPSGKKELSTYYYNRTDESTNNESDRNFQERSRKSGGEDGRFLFRLPEADFYYDDIVPAFPPEFIDRFPRYFDSFGGFGQIVLGINSSSVNNDGVKVLEIFPESIAEEAGLIVGDIIISVDGEAVKNPNDLRRILMGKAAGESMLLGVLRNGEEMKIDATARKSNVFNFYDSETKQYYPNYQNEQDSIPPRQRKRLFSKKEDTKVRLGVTVERMVNYNGLKVVEIAPGSIAEKAGLQKFDIIEKFDRVKLNDPKQLQTLVGDKIGEEVKLTIRREGKKIKKKVRLQ